jgi:hypothetical protein
VMKAKGWLLDKSWRRSYLSFGCWSCAHACI